jgi:serine/threonine protein kinase
MPSALKDFKMLAQLGKGSYGSVMKVERITDGNIYAMKEVNIRRLSPRERRALLPLGVCHLRADCGAPIHGGKTSASRLPRSVLAPHTQCGGSLMPTTRRRTAPSAQLSPRLFPFPVLRLCREDAVNEIRILASIKSKNIVRLVAAAAGVVALQRSPA